ncbi:MULTISPECIES: phosphate signaling complex protein PhoU [Burkholderia]|jgi:phosphate transport system protein|uniref:Phosphate-specific transport system accessory protein PhoU n=2 Tax=Burkholderia gladioli TaxID=28095 RepID=A0A095XF49_BURGA|nr:MULTISPECIES: phosphate signaling complex protein PhoU [Burkholderia]AEA60024.1 Phosphate transport system regulatory protein PhoU [Burkholderia gladioli BSR3]AJX00558.1 phosphate transport system regulatory protein PhoU [Burkholderia gladioli]ASD78695.1 phosphate transport system regulatory protein PhoU [Burkholderia gladioli pv. gladioli]ATF84850.1 phosphate transport system regulatory protein PhoU [Burkholderia gladioli pv. gladioli]AWY56059.1 phosphate transport system regulatory protei
MTDKHLSSQFDADLNAVSSKVLEMGGLVEAQITEAIHALNEFDREAAERVIANEDRLNLMEVEIDEECGNIIARRQPAARDLRLLMSISKTITNLERAGDEAEKIAKRVRRLADEPIARGVNIAEIKVSGEMAVTILRRALDAFARLDTVAAAQIVKDDKEIDLEFRAFVRKLVSYMQEDPRTISVGLDFLFIAKAIERVGDHAKNIAEFIIYIVKGTDVRHQPRDLLDREANS